MTRPSFGLQTSVDHDADLHAWAVNQEQALSDGRLTDLDLSHLADEIAALGNSEYRSLESALLRLLQHLLKWDRQPNRRSRSWSLTIEGQRGNVIDVLRDNPSLKSRQAEAAARADRKARNAMLGETRLATHSIPEVNPYSWDDMMTRPIEWPRSV